MALSYILYDSSGAITGRVFSSSDVVDTNEVPMGGGYILGSSVSDSTHYVDLTGTPTVTARPPSPCTIATTSITANGTSEATISSIPTSASAVINGGTPFTVSDGTLIITSMVPVSFQILIEKFPYLPYEVTVVAT